MSTQHARRMLWACLKRHWILKFFGINAFMWLFFTAYFVLLNHPQFPITVMPLTALDSWIPFQPAALLLYVSLWVYVSIPPACMATRAELIYYGVAAAVLCLIGLAIFLFWPTAVPASDIDYSMHPGFALLQGVDKSGNACPSLHVASAVFSAIWIERLLRDMQFGDAAHWANWLWCIGICYSTLATRQHVVVDVAMGALLGVVIGIASLNLRPKKSQMQV